MTPRSDFAQEGRGGDDATREHSDYRDSGTDRKLREPREPMAACTAVSDPRTEQHEEAGAERDCIA